MPHLPAIAKVFLIFVLILVVNRFKVDLGLSIIGGTFLLGIVFGMSSLQTLAAMGKSFADPLTILLLLLVVFDLTMNQLMETSGQMKRMVEYFSKMVITYDQQSVGGWLEYLNNLETVVAIPCADTNTLTKLVAILDAIFTQFAPMAGDAAIIDCDNPSTSTLTPATDGIESLA